MSNKNKTFFGTENADTYKAGWSNGDGALIYGYGGDDMLTGSQKGDEIYGGTGNDILTGGWGGDYIDGGAGNDKIYGGKERGNSHDRDETLIGGDGDDRIVGGKKDDMIYGDGTETETGTVKFYISGNHHFVVEVDGKQVFKQKMDDDPNARGFVTDEANSGGEVGVTLDAINPDGSNGSVEFQRHMVGVHGGDDGKGVISNSAGTSEALVVRLAGRHATEAAISFQDFDRNDKQVEDQGETVIITAYDGDELVGEVTWSKDDIDPNTFANGGRGVKTLSFTDEQGNLLIFDRVELRAGINAGDNPFTDFSIRSMTFTTVEAGDDTIHGGNGDDTILGGYGDDLINGGWGSDNLYGGAGNDTADYSDLTFNGVPGNIHGVVVNLSDETFAYDVKDYPVSRGWRDNSIEFDIEGGTARHAHNNNRLNDVDTLTDIENIIGTSRRDIIIGDNQNNIFSGLGGEDIFYGSAGNDQISGGDDNDTVIYRYNVGDFLVTITGGSVITLTHATLGFTDTLTDVENFIFDDGTLDVQGLKDLLDIDGGEGGDDLDGNNNDNNIDGGEGDDEINGGGGDDNLDGGDGVDTLSYADSINGIVVNMAATPWTYDGVNTVQGNTALDGIGGTDTIINFENVVGSAHDDYFNMRDIAGELDAGAGNDRINANSSFNDVDGGEGVDHLSFWNEAEGLNIDLAAGTVTGLTSNEIGQIRNIEQITTGNFDDIVTGDDQDNDFITLGGDDIINTGNGNNRVWAGEGNDTITGGTGNDELRGEAGDDIIIGGAGDDWMDGGEDGSDTVDYSGSVSGVIVNLAGGEWIYSGSSTIAGNTAFDGFGGTDSLRNFENLIGSAHNDFLNMRDATGTLDAGAGNDVINSNTSFAHIDGGSGRDHLSLWRETEGLEVNMMTGNLSGLVSGETGTITGIENITTGDFGDIVTGNGAANTIIGRDGNDVLAGGSNNDRLFGGNGRDTLFGDAGTDLLTGDADADTFMFMNSTAFMGVDRIADFNVGDGDALNIADVLTNYNNGDDITNYLQIVDAGPHSNVFVDNSGSGNFAGGQVATLNNVTGLTDEAALLANGNIIV